MIGSAAMPQALAFPYYARSHGSDFYSEEHLPQPEIDRVAARATALIAASPVAAKSEPRRIFLTQGGWRWRLLALRSSTAFGFTRPLIEAVVLNRNDLSGDAVFNGAGLDGRRSLSGVIAHETCHGMLRRRYGLSVALKPSWLIEGYCDHLAQESSLSDEDVRRLKRLQGGPSGAPLLRWAATCRARAPEERRRC